MLLQAAATAHATPDICLGEDLNYIVDVRATPDSVTFQSLNGTLIKGRLGDDWRLDLGSRSQRPVQTQKEYWEQREQVGQSYPPQARKSTYMSVLSRTRVDSTELILTAAAGEGAINDRHCVIDTLARTAYHFPLNPLFDRFPLTRSFNRIQGLDLTSDFIWLGHPHGVMQIDHRSGARRDFAVLPILREDSPVLVDENAIWIAHNGIGIQSIDISSKSLRFWDVMELCQSWPWPSLQGSPVDSTLPGVAIFTNFVRDPDRIQIAGHFVAGGGYLVRGSSFLLTYAKKQQIWSMVRLLVAGGEAIEGVARIWSFDSSGDPLWLGADHVNFSEDDREGFGGLYKMIDGSASRIYMINEIIQSDLVASLEPIDAGFEVETFRVEEHRKRTYRILYSGGVIVASDSIGVDWQAFQEAKKRGRAPSGVNGLPTHLREFCVAPRVVEIRGMPPVEVHRY
jgi:hypothetical protein